VLSNAKRIDRDAVRITTSCGLLFITNPSLTRKHAGLFHQAHVFSCCRNRRRGFIHPGQQPLSCPVQPAHNRTNWYFKCLGNFTVRQLAQVDQRDYLPLVFWQ
jgi:hypothetical protein